MPPDELDVVQHPTLGSLKFPRSMPFDERNGIIADMMKGHAASHAVTDNPATHPGAFQTTKGGAVFNSNNLDGNPESGGEVLHRLLLTGANKTAANIANADRENLQKTARGEPLTPRFLSGRRMLHSVLQTGADMTTPAGAATAAGVALANTNPWTGIPVDAALAAHGGYGVYEHRKALKDALTTGQANPNELEAGLNAGAEMVGGAAGTRTLIKKATVVPIEQQKAAIQRVLDPGWGKREAFQKELAGARPYLGGKGVDGVADLQRRIPAAKQEIWKPAADAFKQFGEESVQGPDGPTTYNKLEARRQELSAQLQKLHEGDPATVQTVFQQNKNPTMLANEQSAINGLLDERMRQAGIHFPSLRETHGAVHGIERQVSGTNTLSEQPQRYGFGRMSRAINPFNKASKLGANGRIETPGMVEEMKGGLRDVVEGRPLWSGKPTDVGVAEGLKTGAPKPDFTTTTYPKPIGPEPAPPGPSGPPPSVMPQHARESIRPNQPQAIGRAGDAAIQTNTLPTEHAGEGDYAGLLPGPPAPFEPPAPMPPVPQVGQLPPAGFPPVTPDRMWTGSGPFQAGFDEPAPNQPFTTPSGFAPSAFPPVPSNPGAPAPPAPSASLPGGPVAAPPPTQPAIPGYKPSEKAATLSAAPRDLGPEFAAGQRTEMITRYKDILRRKQMGDPRVTPADLSEANARLVELGAAQ